MPNIVILLLYIDDLQLKGKWARKAVLFERMTNNAKQCANYTLLISK